MKTLALLASATIALADPAVPPPRVLPKIAFTLADFEAQTQRSAAGNYVMEVPEIANLSLSAIARSVLDTKPVETIAQFTRADGKPRAVRSLISCCAAHAKQFEVAVQFDADAPAFGEMSWVKITGAISFRVENGKPNPVIVVREIVETAPPKNPVLR